MNETCIPGLRGCRRRPSVRPPRDPLVVRPRPLDRRQALVSIGGRTLLAAIGAGGVRALKREGDGGTPIGRFGQRALLWHPSAAPPRPALLPGRPARPDDGWSDDPSDARYNMYRRLPSRHGHERLLRSDGLYDVVVVTTHNQAPRVRGRGSAVFVHVARPGLAPTAGCLAFPAGDWRRLGHLLLARDVVVGAPPRPARPGRAAARKG